VKLSKKLATSGTSFRKNTTFFWLLISYIQYGLSTSKSRSSSSKGISENALQLYTSG
jgi:hypothetical protein